MARTKNTMLDWEAAKAVIDQLVTTEEAATLLGVRPKQVWNLLQAGKIVGKKFGHDWIVYKPSVEDYRIHRPARGRPPSGDPPKTR